MDDLSDDEINRINKLILEETEADFKRFRAAVLADQCEICGNTMDYFNAVEPCMHWLTMPPGFKKKHYKKIFEYFNYDRINSYLRWLVNSYEPFQGINDIKEEREKKTNIIDVTIARGDIEWSFSCSKGCMTGKHNGHPPHYHFQMQVKGRPYIRYAENHIPLTKEDIFALEVKQGLHPKIKHAELYDMGIGSLFEQMEPETILDHMRTRDDTGHAPFHLQTVLMAEEGKTISGDEVADLMEKSRATGKPFASLVRELKNVRAKVFIEPGEGVPKAAPRKGGRGSKKHNQDRGR